MLRMILGEAGTGKTTEVLRQIKEAAGRRQSVLLLVPEHASFEMERRVSALFTGEEQQYITLLSFPRLAEKIFRECGGLTQRPLDEVSRALLMREAISEVQERLTLYRRQAGYTGFISSMLQTVADFKRAGITPARLEEIAAEVLNYHGSGMSVMEMSHRSPVFQEILSQAEADLRTLMHIPDNYKVLFIQGGGTVQFAMVPMNLMKNGVACYVETGAWSKKAIAEAKRYGEVKIVASSADKNFSYLPDCSDLDIPDNADYVYICENETINGTAYHTLPDTKGKVLVADQSSLFLSRPCDVSKYGLIWAGVQKNVGPAGMSIVIIREDLIREDLPEFVPTYLRYKTHADADSLYNTPNCWSIYCCGKVFQYLLANGGLEAMAQRNEEKATVLYDFLDRSQFFTAAVRKEDRSLMNVPFFSPSKEQDAEVAASAKAAGFDNLKGHKSVGGLRASIYNAMPKEGVEALVDFLKKYEAEHT